jgi:hypothetical protein
MMNSPSNSYITRDEILKRIRAVYTRRDEHYPQKRDSYETRYAELEDQIVKREKQRSMACSRQKLDEAKWLLHYSDDWKRLETQLADTAASLDMPNQEHASEQGADGSWGACMNVPYRKLEPTVDALQHPKLNLAEVKPLTFMKRYRDTAWNIGYLWQLQISDIARTGINNRDELGAMQTALAQLLFKDQLHDLLANNDLGFRFADGFDAAFSDYLAQTQHPRTGYWGPWYLIDGGLVMAQDLAFTFHIVNYRHGNIANWPLVIETTLAIKELVYPYGWQPKAGIPYNLHNSYDVVQIFSYGWPHMDWDQKARVRIEIAAMLKWCLTEAIQSGVFKLTDTPREIYYFGVRFLDSLGFWRDSDRFWYTGALRLPEGVPTPYDLCRSLRQEFAEKYDDKSEEADEVLRVLKAAEAETSADQELRSAS